MWSCGLFGVELGVCARTSAGGTIMKHVMSAKEMGVWWEPSSFNAQLDFFGEIIAELELEDISYGYRQVSGFFSLFSVGSSTVFLMFGQIRRLELHGMEPRYPAMEPPTLNERTEQRRSGDLQAI